MGLDINVAHLLAAAKTAGASFDRVVTLGRLSLNIFPAKLVKVLRDHGQPHDELLEADLTTADPVFRALGATKVDALDASDFEGATIVHDLNQPLADPHKEQYDIVVDGGTLEHVFNFPVALKSCMELAKVGGRVIIHNCTNNLCGHGFYQFSPELFWRAFSPENGFEIERMILHMVGPYGRWYEVSDPKQIRERVELISFTPIHILVQARRTASVPIFATPPMQSDYSVMWDDAKTEGAGGDQAAPPTAAATQSLPWMSRKLPGLARLIHVIKTGLIFYNRQSFRNRKFFKPVKRL